MNEKNVDLAPINLIYIMSYIYKTYRRKEYKNHEDIKIKHMIHVNAKFLALKKCDIKWRRIQVCFAVHSINSLNDTQRFTKRLQLMSWRSNQRSLYFVFSKHKTCIIILMITEIFHINDRGIP